MKVIAARFALSALCVGLMGCEPSSSTQVESSTQAAPVVSSAQVADSLDVHYEVVSNLNNNCQFDGDCFDARLTLTLPIDANHTDWAIYFSNTKPIKYDSSSLFDIEHINGDLHKVTPTAEFTGFEANTAYVIPFQAMGATVTKNDVMPNFIYQHGNDAPVVIASTQEVFNAETSLWELPHAGEFTTPEQWRRSANDNVPLATAQWLYEQYQGQQSDAAISENRVIPSLLDTQWTNERVKLEAGVNATFELPKVLEDSLNAVGVTVSENGLPVHFTQQSMAPESYGLAIAQDGIVITAGDDAGLYYAVQSLTQLFDTQTQSFPIGQATDAPRFAFRGVHTDVARNYHDKAFLLRLIEQMGALKFNKLHLHLAEDEAWRIQIPGLPELTEIGAVRCFDLEDKTCLQPQLGAGTDPASQVNGYLTVDDYKTLLQVAQQHHIEVIPSLDMPGHSRAAVKAMNARHDRFIQQEMPERANEFMLIEPEDTTVYSSIQYYNDNTINPCLPSSYHFIDKVLTEIKAMHDEAGVPLQRYHIGADETAGAWVESPACKVLMEEEGIDEAKHLTAYFVAKVTKMVNDMGVMAGAWSDGLSHVEPMKLGSRIQSNLWETLPSGGQHKAHEMANLGWDAVLSLPDVLYFDFPYMPHPDESGYYWGSRYTSTFQVFQFMPENLPAHAEFCQDSMGNSYSSDDTSPLTSGSRFAGIQAQVWSETLRHEAQAEYMLFPRLVAVAERAWHKADWEVPYEAGRSYGPATRYFTDDMKAQQKADWQGFIHAFGTNILPSLERAGVFYRLPPPGAVIENNKLKVINSWPMLNAEYTLDGGVSWMAYSESVELAAESKVGVRSFTHLNNRRSRTLWLNAGQE